MTDNKGPGGIATLYPDGSCDPRFALGGWAAVLILDDREMLIDGLVENTTHNRMELLAVIKGIEALLSMDDNLHEIRVYTDSQYVAGLPGREEGLKGSGYKTKSGKDIRNGDLLVRLYSLLDECQVSFFKVKAHQKQGCGADHNRLADRRCRRIVRNGVKTITEDNR